MDGAWCSIGQAREAMWLFFAELGKYIVFSPAYSRFFVRIQGPVGQHALASARKGAHAATGIKPVAAASYFFHIAHVKANAT